MPKAPPAPSSHAPKLAERPPAEPLDAVHPRNWTLCKPEHASSAKTGVRSQVGDNANKLDSSFLPSLAAIPSHLRHPESPQSMRYARLARSPAQALSYTRRTEGWVCEVRTVATGHQTATSWNARVHIEPPHPYGVHFLGPSGASSGMCAARYFGREVIRRRPPWGRGPSQGPPKSLGNGWRLVKVNLNFRHCSQGLATVYSYTA